jgi:hypothetical protein
VPVLFRTGGALGINPSELSPHGRLPARFHAGRTHVPFLLSVIPPPEGSGPAQQAAASRLRPFRESLVTGTVLVHRRLAAPVGLTLLGLTAKALLGISPKLLPRAFLPAGLATADRRRLGVSIGPSFVPPTSPASQTRGKNDPYRVSAP